MGTVLLSTAPVNAEIFDLGEIVVTPYRYSGQLGQSVSDVTLMTAEDIRSSNAGQLVDVLRSVPGIIVRDYYSNGATARVDMAGFGEQGLLNTLLLVDGRRINDVDLSGADWTQVPLDQVERIEVIRGGSAAVLYGDNASGGVINIITRKGSAQPRMTLEGSYGSYDMNKQKLSLSGGKDEKLSYFLSGGRESTNGYRRNSFNKANDFAGRVKYELTEVLSFHADTSLHQASYGMPSALFQHHLDTYGPLWARYGEDHAHNRDYTLATGVKADFKENGELGLDVSLRRKAVDSYFPSSQNDTRRNRMEIAGFNPQYVLARPLFGHDNKFITGVDLSRVFFTSRNYLYSNEGVFKNYSNIRKDALGVYVQDEFSVTDKLTAVGGYRYEQARYAFAYHDFTAANPDRDAKLKPHAEAFNTGLVYAYRDDSNIFLNVSRSFRFPQVDEFVGNYDINFQQFLNTDLRPQSAMDYRAGIRHRFSPGIKSEVSFFRMHVKDEIYYDPAGGIYGFGENENYPRTVHQGLNAAVEGRLCGWLSSFANYSFTDAYFGKGAYVKNQIPLVPRHQVSAGLRFALPRDLTFSLAETYVGRRFLLNDQANSQSRLNGYAVTDADLVWKGKGLSGSVGVHNVFNRKYAEVAGYASDSSNGFVMDKFYYPSPGRNFMVKLSYEF
jgi:iron complex outermembrane receptor protein